LEGLKSIIVFQVSLKGITSVAGGLIAAAAIILMQKSGITIDNLIITVLTVISLLIKKIPTPLIVVATILTGFLIKGT
jgi:chromate transporter